MSNFNFLFNIKKFIYFLKFIVIQFYHKMSNLATIFYRKIRQYFLQFFIVKFFYILVTFLLQTLKFRDILIKKCYKRIIELKSIKHINMKL